MLFQDKTFTGNQGTRGNREGEIHLEAEYATETLPGIPCVS